MNCCEATSRSGNEWQLNISASLPLHVALISGSRLCWNVSCFSGSRLGGADVSPVVKGVACTLFAVRCSGSGVRHVDGG